SFCSEHLGEVHAGPAAAVVVVHERGGVEDGLAAAGLADGPYVVAGERAHAVDVVTGSLATRGLGGFMGPLLAVPVGPGVGLVAAGDGPDVVGGDGVDALDPVAVLEVAEVRLGEFLAVPVGDVGVV